MKRRPQAGTSPSIDGSVLLAGPRRHLWLAAAVNVACAVAFVADLTHDIPCAFGVFYLPLVCTAVFYRDPRWAWWLAAGAIGMVLLGQALPVADLDLQSLANRGLSIAAILATAALVRYARTTHDLLARETQRAQSADRLKTQIFSGLGDALQAPAAAIAGLADTLAASIRPERRNELERLRSEAGRLLAAIENLVDLAAATDRLVQLETLDVGRIVREAVDAIRHNASESHIWLETDPGAAAVPAIADAWAVRRIVDNLLGNALKFTPRGGHIRVGIETGAGRAAIVVEDTGPGIPADVLQQVGQPFVQAKNRTDAAPASLGNGLALCRKLADAMGATLAFSSGPGQGTRVQVSLRTT